jgi:hypothetical protein
MMILFGLPRKAYLEKHLITPDVIHIYFWGWRATQTPLQTGDELMCTGRVNSSCSTSGICGVGPVTNIIFGFAIS